MTSFERDDAIRALTAMRGQGVAVLIEGRISRASYLAAFHGLLVGPEPDEDDQRWMIDDGQEPQIYDGTWFMVPLQVEARLSEGTVVLVHDHGQTTVTADVPRGQDLSEWRRDPT